MLCPLFWRRLAAMAAAPFALALIGMLPAPSCAQQQPPQQNQQTERQGAHNSGGMMGGNNMAGGSNSSRVSIPVLPSITMTAVPGFGAAPLTVGFFANGVDPDGKGFVSYLWTFGDGQVSMAPPMMFFHTYKTPGTYIATITATTADGRTATSYVGIIVRPAAD